MSPSDFVNPANLASTPMTPEAHSPASDSGPSRKRARTELSSEEKKEARAHRNRIAAQNSRDRRKAQFSYLERRVAELEEENRQLRAGMGMTRVDEKKVEEQERERARERENEELRERIRTLEKGWDAVVKALAAQGLPTGVAPPTPMSEAAQSPSSNDTTSTHSTSPSAAASEPAVLTQQPVTSTLSVPPTTVFPLSPAPTSTSMDLDYPSPDVSYDDFAAVPAFTAEQTASEQDSTRHLARVATIEDQSSMSLQRSTGGQAGAAGLAVQADDAHVPVDDAAMDSLLREILTASPYLSPSNLPAEGAASADVPAPQVEASPAAAPAVGKGVLANAKAAEALWNGEGGQEAENLGHLDLELDLTSWMGDNTEMQKVLDMFAATNYNSGSSADAGEEVLPANLFEQHLLNPTASMNVDVC